MRKSREVRTVVDMQKHIVDELQNNPGCFNKRVKRILLLADAPNMGRKIAKRTGLMVECRSSFGEHLGDGTGSL